MAERCIICEKKIDIKSIYLPYLFNKKKSYKYFFFPCCGYYRQSKSLSDKEIEKLYGENYADFTTKGLFFFLKKITRILKALLFRKYIKDKKILEIGSGKGEFLDVCKKFGASEVVGVEISTHASNIAKKKYKIKVHSTSLEEFNSSKKYDTAFMFHVIEHFKDPLFALKKTYNLLEEKGVLIMETPNWDSWEKEVFKKKWYGWQVPFHTFIFSPSALKKLVEKAGFKTKRIAYSSIPNSWIKSLAPNKFLYFLLPIATIVSVIAVMRRKSGRFTIICQKDEG